MSMTHRQRSLTKADGRAVRKRRCGSVDVEDEHSNLTLKQSASGTKSAPSNKAAVGHEEHVDDDDEDDSNADKSEESGSDNNDDNDDEHADDGTDGTADDADDDESGDSNDSSDEDEDVEEQDLNFCKCGLETTRCEFCSDLFCRDCAIKRRWRKMHPDVDYDSDEHAEAFDLAHICFNCHHQVLHDAAEHGYNDMF